MARLKPRPRVEGIPVRSERPERTLEQFDRHVAGTDMDVRSVLTMSGVELDAWSRERESAFRAWRGEA